jgi:hypothetical protein
MKNPEELHRGYSMLFDEYEIYFTSEIRVDIFTSANTSENTCTIKILSHE